MNLTAATLNAVLKYPWFRGEGPKNKPKKFGAYQSEESAFLHARGNDRSQRQSLEAAVMDHADAVAYSVHDLDDFYRAGLIPLETIGLESRLDGEIEAFKKSRKLPVEVIERNRQAIDRMFFYLRAINSRYTGTYPQRVLLRAATSRLIDLFVSSVKLGDPNGSGSPLLIPERVEVPMRFLQNLVWRYVIMNPRLGTQQEGQRRIIKTLFTTYRAAIRKGEKGRPLIPPSFEEEFNKIVALPPRQRGRRARVTRLAVDIVASLTDHQASVLYRRLTGVAGGSVSDRMEG